MISNLPAPSASDPPLSHEALARIGAEHIRQLYRHQTTALVTHLIVAPFVVAVLWPHSPHSLLIGWISGLYLTQTLRALTLVHFFRHPPADDALPNWARLSVLVSFVNGLFWGWAAVYLLEPGNPMGLLVVTGAIMGTSSGALATSGPYPPAFFAYVLPSLGTLSLVLLLSPYPEANWVGWLCLILLIGVSSMNRILYRTVDGARRISFENQMLREQAQTQSGLLDTTLQSVHQGIAATDSDGHLSVANARFGELLGIAQPVVGTDLGAQLLSALPDTTLHPDQTTSVQGSRGRFLELDINPTPEQGRVLTVTDVTSAKVRELALDRARQEAERANASKTRFLASASHDLRQPIHALGLFFSTLSDQVRTPQTERLIGRIDDAIDSINTMLNALLDISKLDAGIVKATPVDLPLNELLQRLGQELQAEAGERHIGLRVRPTRLWAHSDPVLLEGMLRNLMVNALLHTGSGRILLSARQKGDVVRCEVRDTGPGIPANQLDSIFQEFHQLDNPERSRSKGLGLGLAIVRRTAQLLGHPVRVDSIVGRGSCFRLTLPRVEPLGIGPVASLPVSDDLGCPWILAIDDDLEVLEAITTLLAHWGCIVDQADSQSAALALLAGKDRAPDLLLVDYRLRDDVTGDQVIKFLQQSTGRPIPAIIITGDTAPNRLREAKQAGYPLLHKPVQAARLRSAIELLTAGKLDSLSENGDG